MVGLDALGKSNLTPDEIKSEIDKYEKLRENIRNALPSGKTTIERPINGNDITNLGIKKGPMVGQILKLIDDKLLENPFLSREEALEIAKEYISLNKKSNNIR